MGLLTVGTALTWNETKKYADYVRLHGIRQFINQYHRHKDRKNDCFYFGDELEYTLVKFDHKKKVARLNLSASNSLAKLSGSDDELRNVNWTHEYASYMLEGTPARPYAYFNTIEDNMKERRNHVLSVLESSEDTCLTITVFPRLGCQAFTAPEHLADPTNGILQSLFLPDEVLNNLHPRFQNFARNIRQRRGEKVAINVPIFIDANTPTPFNEDFSWLSDDSEAQHATRPDHIYMDDTGFGFGCSCLQMTFQAGNIDEAKHLYDQLAPLTPIMMALTAASPVYRGYLADVDHRWSVIASAVDDRTQEERGATPLKNDKFLINKSRYDSIDSYLSPEGKKYNDIKVVHDKEIYQALVDNGIDEQLSEHIAHLFIRDPISLFSESITNVDDEKSTELFETIQSTNWQTLRFKPPPSNGNIGWRVEFRPTECQLTDFENAALTVFVVIMTRVILSYKLNLLIPISKVDENIHRAQKRDAVLKEKFYFRNDITPACSTQVPLQDAGDFNPALKDTTKVDANEFFSHSGLAELSIGEIINGKEDVFTGLIPVIKNYITDIELDVSTRCTIERYLSFISQRASGKVMTAAKWMREFIRNHTDYKGDSVVSDEIQYDLLQRCDQISKGLKECPELVPKF